MLHQASDGTSTEMDWLGLGLVASAASPSPLIITPHAQSIAAWKDRWEKQNYSIISHSGAIVKWAALFFLSRSTRPPRREGSDGSSLLYQFHRPTNLWFILRNIKSTRQMQQLPLVLDERRTIDIEQGLTSCFEDGLDCVFNKFDKAHGTIWDWSDERSVFLWNDFNLR